MHGAAWNNMEGFALMNLASRAHHVRRRIRKTLDHQLKLMDQMIELTLHGDSRSTEILKIQVEIDQLTKDRLVLTHELAALEGAHDSQDAASTPVPRTATHRRPVRELILDVLDEIGVPSSSRTLSEVADALYAMDLPTRKFASVRRDEFDAWENVVTKKAPPRPAWILPAINTISLTGMPQLMTSSAWALENRMIGSRTPRVNHLRTLLSLLRSRDSAEERGDERAADRLSYLVLRHGESLPGALSAGYPADLEQIRDLAAGELEKIESSDLEERQSAAEYLGRLDESQRFWGHSRPKHRHARSVRSA